MTSRRDDQRHAPRAGHKRPDAGGPLDDAALGELLRATPEVRAKPDFTAGVLARLDGHERRGGGAGGVLGGASRFGRQARLALAASAILAAFLAPIAWNEFAGDPQPAGGEQRAGLGDDAAEDGEAELARLRAEHERLSRELREMMRLGSSAPGPVYLGGDERVDIVFDPTELVARDEGLRPAAARDDDTRLQ